MNINIKNFIEWFKFYSINYDNYFEKVKWFHLAIFALKVNYKRRKTRLKRNNTRQFSLIWNKIDLINIII